MLVVIHYAKIGKIISCNNFFKHFATVDTTFVYWFNGPAKEFISNIELIKHGEQINDYAKTLPASIYYLTMGGENGVKTLRFGNRSSLNFKLLVKGLPMPVFSFLSREKLFF